MNSLLATRAAAHAAVAAVITFSRLHNGELGINSLILFGALYLAASLGTHLLDHRYKLMSARLALPVIAPTVVALIALTAKLFGNQELLTFRLLVGLLMLGFVITELLHAKKVSRKTLDGKEAVITAVASAIMFGIAIAVDVGPVPMVGFFGAYHAILAVHLGISAATPKK